MQVKFSAEDKPRKGKAGVFISKKDASMKKEDRKQKKFVFHTVIQLFL